MSAKQDLSRARTTQDLERKWNFGRTFAEMFGLAEKAQKSADEAKEAAVGVDKALTQEEIFNRLTNDGEDQGIYLKDGKIYINGTYMGIGTISSVNGKVQIDLTQETEPVFNTGISTNGLTVRGDVAGAEKVFKMDAQESPYYDGYTGTLELFSVGGKKLFRLSETASLQEPITPEGAILKLFNIAGTRAVALGALKDTAGIYLYSDANDANAVEGLFYVNQDGSGSYLHVTHLAGKEISWKSNGDGTYTLIGK